MGYMGPHLFIARYTVSLLQNKVVYTFVLFFSVLIFFFVGPQF